MPEPGDLIAAFSLQPERCFRIGQATICRRPTVPRRRLGNAVWRDCTGLARRGVPPVRAEGDQWGGGGLRNGPEVPSSRPAYGSPRQGPKQGK